jgi:hypothetical protein
LICKPIFRKTIESGNFLIFSNAFGLDKNIPLLSLIYRKKAKPFGGACFKALQEQEAQEFRLIQGGS